MMEAPIARALVWVQFRERITRCLPLRDDEYFRDGGRLRACARVLVDDRITRASLPLVLQQFC
jgi:hypothetical protein